MTLKCLERSEFKADAEWLAAYDEDLARTCNAYCAAATEFLTVPDLQYAYRAREEIRRIEEDLSHVDPATAMQRRLAQDPGWKPPADCWDTTRRF